MGVFVGIEFALSVDKSVGCAAHFSVMKGRPSTCWQKNLRFKSMQASRSTPDGDFYPTLAQNVEAATAHFRKGIDTTHHALANAAAHDKR